MSTKIFREDWSLHRKGQLDQQRHQKKVRDAIKKNLADIVSEESIIMSDGKQIIKVPVKTLDEYRFRYDHGKQKQGGQGQGDSKVGDVIGTDKQQGSGKGPGAGSEPGIDYYEAEITIDELAEMIFEDLGLPNLERKKAPELEHITYQFNDIRKSGITGNIDRKRTIMENIKRNALQGIKGIQGINREDLRYKTWEEKYEYESNAVVLAMMDTSGSL